VGHAAHRRRRQIDRGAAVASSVIFEERVEIPLAIRSLAEFRRWAQSEESAEPDIVFVSHEALLADRVHLVPGSSQEPGRYVELEGAADLIVEIVSDSSVGKDTRRLPEAYSRAGVREFWLADARNDPVVVCF
jgi:Uma2 family endonuclease